jgi:uncharacterized protein
MLNPLGAGDGMLAALILFLAFFVRGIAGFGSGLLAIPLLIHFIPLTLVVAVMSLLDLIAAGSQGIRHRHAIAWREILPLLPTTLMGVVIAILLFQWLEGERLRQILGTLLIIYVAYTLLRRQHVAARSRYWSLPAGFGSGLVGTLFATGGPFYVIYLRLRHLERHAFRATLATLFLIDGGVRITAYFVTGFYTLDALYLTIMALPIIAIALYLGGQIHSRLTPQAFERAIAMLLLLSGISLLL